MVSPNMRERLEHAVKHGKFNLKKSGVLKGGDDKNADI